MQALAGLAIATLVIVSIAVAIRLLGLHRRSGELPELLLGSMLLLSVGLGYPLRIVSIRVGAETANLLLAISSLSVAAAYACLVVFTRRVFRPDSRAGLAAAVVLLVALVGSALWDATLALVATERHLASALTAPTLIAGASVMCTYVWAAGESLRYRAIVERRIRVGLADPVVSNRLLLWSLMSLFVIVGILLNMVAGFLGVNAVESPVVLIGSSTTGLGQAILLVLAFTPPRAYLAWVRGPLAPVPA
jgi:hypothetical protein